MKNKFLLAAFAAIIIVVALVTFGSKNKTNSIKSDLIQKPVQNNINNKSDGGEPTPFGEINKHADVDVANKQMPQKKVSLEELAGPVHNEYGIRDDIYKYIQTVITPNNTKAMKAALTYAATIQFVYYKANKEQALKLVPKMFLAYRCLRYTQDQDLTFVAREINNLMGNNIDRDDHMRDIDKRYFGWEILGTGMSSIEEEKVCNSGEY